MRYVVYGAGAVGGVIGARLHLAGSQVQVVARGPHLDAIRARGLRLDSPDGSTTVRVPAATSVADLSVDVDTCVLVCVKSQQTAAVIADLTSSMPPEIVVVSVQNGVANERSLLRHFEHVLGVCVMLPTSHLEPGVVVANSAPVPGMLDIGCFPSGVDDRCEVVASALRDAGFECVVRPDVMAWKYRKLVTNLGNAVQACCRPGPASERLEKLAREEGERVLVAAGIDVVSVAQDRERRGDILRPGAIGGRGGGSTWQSLRRGTGSVESDYLNGEICLLGRLLQIRTPTNDLVRRTAIAQARAGAEPGTLDANDLLAALT
ncbi:MAG: ketopantoate reductase family protein [Nocardioidaceae bacterium]